MADHVLYLQLHLWNWIVVFSPFIFTFCVIHNLHMCFHETIAKGVISIQPATLQTECTSVSSSFIGIDIQLTFSFCVTFISSYSTKHNRNVMFNIYNINQFCKWFTFYAFSRCFYPKRLTLHSVYNYYYFLSVCVFPGNWTHDLLRC